jgi:hypothetical protein
MPDETKLTNAETAAVKALQRLGRKWPKTLMLFASGNTLQVRKPDSSGNYDVQKVVAFVDGFPNDGGDGGDVFD